MKQKLAGCSIEFDFTNALSKVVGDNNGITDGDLNEFKSCAESAYAKVEILKKEGKLGFCKLPYTPEAELDEIIKTADNIASNYSDFVVLGIGGSALGNIALQTALNHPYYNQLQNEPRPRLYVLDNVDPDLISGVLDVLPLEKTFFNVITKSGSTAETMSQFLIFRDIVIKRIGEQAFKKQFLLTTDPQKGILRKIAMEEGLMTLPIPSDVGGRFSVMTAVGLLSAAVCGIDIKELIAGAKKMDEIISSIGSVYQNPAVMNAVIHYIMDVKKGKKMSVMIPYVQCLKDVADWYRQLLAESLGKKLDRNGNIVNTGTTPIKSLGATDQHSQIQLYMEGPFDKIITFLGVNNYKTDITIPSAYTQIGDVSYLCGQTMSKLIKAEQKSTEVALANAGRPNCTITLDDVNAKTIGALMYMYEYQIALGGEMYNIDAFDQPGVEEGKNLTYGMMGKPGYDEKRVQVEEASSLKSSSTTIKFNLS